MAAITCDECKKKNCPQRVAGAICSLSSETTSIVKMFSTRDPVLVARNLAKVLESEASRYEKAKENEDIGKEIEIPIYDKKGDFIKFIYKKKELDNKVSGLGLNLLKGGKIINDILNPPKTSPLFQQNNQYNVSVGVPDEVNALKGENRKDAIKFIDDQLDAKRKN